MTNPQAPNEQDEPQGVDAVRVLEKVRMDPMGKLLVQNAVQECMLEDQQAMIESLKQKLLEKNGPAEA